MKHDLRLASALGDRHLGRSVTIAGTPPITGVLTGLIPCADTVTLVLLVGGRRAFFPLEAGACVEVRRGAA